VREHVRRCVQFPSRCCWAWARHELCHKFVHRQDGGCTHAVGRHSAQRQARHSRSFNNAQPLPPSQGPGGLIAPARASASLISRPLTLRCADDINASLAFMRDVVDVVTGVLATAGPTTTPTGLPEAMQATFSAMAQRGLTMRQRRDLSAGLAQRVEHADRAGFEARMNARFAAAPFSWRVPAFSITDREGNASQVALEYMPATDLLIGSVHRIAGGLNYVADPQRGGLLNASRTNNSLLIGAPSTSIITGRAVVPVSMPIWSPAIDLPLWHADSLLQLDSPPNETRWPLRGSFVGSLFQSIDYCASPVPAVTALADVTAVAEALASLAAPLQSSVVVGPVSTPTHRAVLATGAFLVDAIVSTGSGVQSVLSNGATFAAALDEAEQVAGRAVKSWLVAAGGRVLQITIAPRVDAVRQQSAKVLDGTVAGIGCGLSMTLAAAVWGCLATSVAAQEARRRKRAVKAAQASARLAREQQTQFILHEIRVPLNSIALGLQDLVEDPATPSAVLALLRPLKSASDGMITIISDVLDLAKMERADFAVRLTDCTVAELADEAVRRMQPMASRHHVTLLADVVSVSGLRVRADGVRILQVLTNLVSNGIKFSPQDGTGRVSLLVQQSLCDAACKWHAGATHAPHAGSAVATTPPRCISAPASGTPASPSMPSALAMGADVVHVLFSVSDNGCGMPPADAARLFRPFVQLEAGEAYRGRGTGLGLAIAQRIAEGHRGSMSVCSVEGAGSTFTLEIHADVVSHATDVLPHPLAAQHYQHRDARLFLSDVTDASARSLDRIEPDERLRTGTADSGGSDTLPTAPTSATSGWDNRLRRLGLEPRLGSSGRHFPGSPERQPTSDAVDVDVTATGTAEDTCERSLPGVMSDEPVRPMHSDGMTEMSTLPAAPAPDIPPALASSSETAPPGLRWLVVDDAEMNAKLLARLLQRRRPADMFLCVASGSRALQACGITPPSPVGTALAGGAGAVAAFDVVLTDKNMPCMDGVELTRALRGGGFTGVVLGCSGTVDPADRRALRAAGADGMVCKPVDVAALLDLLRDALAARGKSMPPAGAQLPVARRPAPAARLPQQSLPSVGPPPLPALAPRLPTLDLSHSVSVAEASGVAVAVGLDPAQAASRSFDV